MLCEMQTAVKKFQFQTVVITGVKASYKKKIKNKNFETWCEGPKHVIHQYFGIRSWVGSLFICLRDTYSLCQGYERVG